LPGDIYFPARDGALGQFRPDRLDKSSLAIEGMAELVSKFRLKPCIFLALGGEVLCSRSGRSFGSYGSVAARDKRPFGGFQTNPGNFPVHLGLIGLLR
jgi:hypothetical protein